MWLSEAPLYSMTTWKPALPPFCTKGHFSFLAAPAVQPCLGPVTGSSHNYPLGTTSPWSLPASASANSAQFCIPGLLGFREQCWQGHNESTGAPSLEGLPGGLANKILRNWHCQRTAHPESFSHIHILATRNRLRQSGRTLTITKW